MKRNFIIESLLLTCTRLVSIKHHIKTVWVVGKTGTVVASELIEGVLKKYEPVRRQLFREKTSYSAMLTILGYEDRDYSPFEWFILFIKILTHLVIGKRVFSWVILQINTFDTSKARLLQSSLIPETIISLDNPVDERLKAILKTNNATALIRKEVENISTVTQPLYSVFYGERKTGFFRLVTWRTVTAGTSVSGIWNRTSAKFKSIIIHRGNYLRDPYCFSIAFGLHQGLSIKKIQAILPALIISAKS